LRDILLVEIFTIWMGCHAIAKKYGRLRWN
jgi:hypothetical protein